MSKSNSRDSSKNSFKSLNNDKDINDIPKFSWVDYIPKNEDEKNPKNKDENFFYT